MRRSPVHGQFMTVAVPGIATHSIALLLLEPLTHYRFTLRSENILTNHIHCHAFLQR